MSYALGEMAMGWHTYTTPYLYLDPPNTVHFWLVLVPGQSNTMRGAYASKRNDTSSYSAFASDGVHQYVVQMEHTKHESRKRVYSVYRRV
jgi:uncharacterized cysteine cluster protein YcgN (CxxCxxCC family)